MLLPAAELLLGRSLGFYLKFPSLAPSQNSFVTLRKTTANKLPCTCRELIPVGMADPGIWEQDMETEGHLKSTAVSQPVSRSPPGIPFQGCFSGCSITSPPHQQPRNGNSGTIPVGDPSGKGMEQHNTAEPLPTSCPGIPGSGNPPLPGAHPRCGNTARPLPSWWEHHKHQPGPSWDSAFQNRGITLGWESSPSPTTPSTAQVTPYPCPQGTHPQGFETPPGMGAPVLPCARDGQPFPGRNCSQYPPRTRLCAPHARQFHNSS